jgi:DNA-binding transcriptional MerR regulator
MAADGPGKDQPQLDLGIQIPDKLAFRIGEVAELVGVETHVLRYWETEFRIRPQRSGTGQRMYQRKDIAKFLRIRHLLHDEKFTIAGAKKVLSGQADEAVPLDEGGVREAAERLTALRTRIKEARDRLGKALVIPEAPKSEG